MRRRKVVEIDCVVLGLAVGDIYGLNFGGGGCEDVINLDDGNHFWLPNMDCERPSFQNFKFSLKG